YDPPVGGPAETDRPFPCLGADDAGHAIRRHKAMTGTLYGIGVGPGDPELLTVKAARILRQVSVIAYPAPPEGESMARTIAAPHLPGGQQEIALRIPFSPEPQAASAAYDRAAGLLSEALRQGDVAV